MKEVKERLRIYNRMLKDFSLPEKKNRADVYSVGGFCRWIKANLGNEFDVNSFPELIKQQPKKNWLIGGVVSGYWWSHNRGGKQTTRVKALKRAMNLCNQTLKKK